MKKIWKSKGTIIGLAAVCILIVGTCLIVRMLTLQKSYTKGLLTLLTHRETSEAPAYFYRSCGRHP